MPTNAALKWLCLAFTTLGILNFVDFFHDQHHKRRRSRSSCYAGKRILEVRRQDFHDSSACRVEQYRSVVETVRHQDGRVELGVAPIYKRPVPGSTLDKELSKSPRQQTFLEKVKPHLELGSSDALAALGSEPLLLPRKLFGQFLLWVACDSEFSGCPWYDKLKNWSNPPILACWHSLDSLGLQCLAMFSSHNSFSANWDRWPDYGASFERLAAAGANADYYRIVTFPLGTVQVAVYSEVDATTDAGEAIELKTMSPKRFETFAEQRMINVCFQMLSSGCKNLCIGIVDRTGNLVEVEEMSLKQMSDSLARVGVEPAVLLGRVSAAIAEISSACLRERDSGSSFELVFDGNSLYLDQAWACVTHLLRFLSL